MRTLLCGRLTRPALFSLIVAAGLTGLRGIASAEPSDDVAAPKNMAAAVGVFAPPAWVKDAADPNRKPKTPLERPVAGVDHVFVISIDGCRPDVLLRADAPNIRQLMARGAFTFWARTVPASVTLPSHTSMLTGVDPRKHGVEWNRELPFSQPVYSNYPTLFAQAKGYGYHTAMVVGKAKFGSLVAPNTIDTESVPEKTGKDTDIAEEAVKVITGNTPDVMFVHLPGVDGAGHKVGWGTNGQLEAVNNADKAVGQIVQAIASAGLTDRAVVILTADHGGAGKSHGPDDPRCRYIPWICVGPGVNKNLDINVDSTVEVRTEDTFATACWLMGIPLDPKIDGHPVMAAFNLPKPPAQEMLKDVPTAKAESAKPEAAKPDGGKKKKKKQ